jgi:flagellar hook protein FlgE
MALATAVQSALSGMAAAEASISVIANNMANANTNGFKASKVDLATQPPQTLGLGAAPSGTRGGTNPVQMGRGVSVEGISMDDSPGPLGPDGLELSNTDIAHSIVQLNADANLYVANLRVLDTATELLDELVLLGRPAD